MKSKTIKKIGKKTRTLRRKVDNAIAEMRKGAKKSARRRKSG